MGTRSTQVQGAIPGLVRPAGPTSVLSPRGDQSRRHFPAVRRTVRHNDRVPVKRENGQQWKLMVLKSRAAYHSVHVQMLKSSLSRAEIEWTVLVTATVANEHWIENMHVCMWVFTDWCVHLKGKIITKTKFCNYIYVGFAIQLHAQLILRTIITKRKQRVL